MICKLGKSRERLSEYMGLTNLPFEIQIRTVLQHAWAELAHDRSYKFSGKLRDDLQRRVNLCSAILEMMDREFVSIVKEVDEYETQLISQPLVPLLNRNRYPDPDAICGHCFEGKQDQISAAKKH